MGNLRTLVLLVLAGSLAATTGFAADDPAELRVLKARIDFGNRPGTDRLTLRVAFDPALLVEGLSPANSPLAVTIGPETVTSLPTLDERAKLRVKRDRIYRLQIRATRLQRDSLKMRIDMVKGILRLTGQRLDLREIRGLGAEDVSFTLTLAGTTFEKNLEMGVGKNRWRYRYTGKGQGVVGGNQGGGGLPIDDTEDPGPVTFRMLGLYGYGNTYGPREAVCRTEQEFATEWAKYATPQSGGLPRPLPTVDFTKEIVIFIDHGVFPNGGYGAEIRSVTEAGDGLLVEWWAWTPGTCPTISAPSSLFGVAAVTRRDGPVTFNKTTVPTNCQ